MRRRSCIKNFFRIMVFGVLLLCIMFGFVSCNSSNNSNDENGNSTSGGKEGFDRTVLTVGDVDVSKREVLLYLLQIKNKYEPSLGNDIWKYNLEKGETFENIAKNEVVNQVVQLKIIQQEAEALDVSLSQEELQKIYSSANEYLGKITKEDQSKYGITYDTVVEVLSDNYLAEKVFSVVTNEADTNVSDEEAKQIKVDQLVILTNGVDSDGNTIKMSNDQKKEALERAKLLLNDVDAHDFVTYANSNSDIKPVEVILGKGDIPEADDVLFSLKEGQVSPIIETENAYYIFKVVSTNEEQATAEKKEEIIEQRQESVFTKTYETWSGKYKVIRDSSFWDDLNMADLVQ